ncbi:MAG: segregation/condensation protein A, partial [Roseicyclus sp.]|nr:segregation/condensation protein A [Roseicyclus sp.]
MRGLPEDVTTARKITYTASLIDLMQGYARIRTRDEFRPYVMDRESVFTMEEALERMRGLIGFAGDWTDISSYIPEGWEMDPKRRRSATASTFAAALELAKAGKVTLRQTETFAPIQLKRKDGPQ